MIRKWQGGGRQNLEGGRVRERKRRMKRSGWEERQE